MAALLRRGLRAVALLSGASRRAAAAAWPGDPEQPDPALEEAERFGAAGPETGPGAGPGGRSRLSPQGAAAAGGSAAAAAAAGAGRGTRRPRAHPELAGDGTDAVRSGAGRAWPCPGGRAVVTVLFPQVPAAGAARGVAAGAPGPGIRCEPGRGAAGAAEPGLPAAAPPPAAGRARAERRNGTGTGSGRRPRGARSRRVAAVPAAAEPGRAGARRAINGWRGPASPALLPPRRPWAPRRRRCWRRWISRPGSTRDSGGRTPRAPPSSTTPSVRRPQHPHPRNAARPRTAPAAASRSPGTHGTPPPTPSPEHRVSRNPLPLEKTRPPPLSLPPDSGQNLGTQLPHPHLLHALGLHPRCFFPGRDGAHGSCHPAWPSIPLSQPPA